MVIIERQKISVKSYRKMEFLTKIYNFQKNRLGISCSRVNKIQQHQGKSQEIVLNIRKLKDINPYRSNTVFALLFFDFSFFFQFKLKLIISSVFNRLLFELKPKNPRYRQLFSINKAKHSVFTQNSIFARALRQSAAWYRFFRRVQLTAWFETGKHIASFLT